MLILIPVMLLLLSVMLMGAIRLVQPKFAYFWLIAALGSLVSWLVVIGIAFRLPQETTLVHWQPAGIFTASPGLILDSTSWAFTLALATLNLAVMFTSVTHTQPDDWRAWAGSLAFTAIGMLAALAGNPLTVLLAWAALDFLELIILLGQVSEGSARDQIVISFSARVAGMLLLVGAVLLASSAGEKLAFDSIPPQSALLLLMSSGLRLGVLPLHVPFIRELNLRRGLGTTLRLIPAAASLSLLARAANVGVATPTSPWLLLLALLAALYGAWSWMNSSDELSGRPFWIIATAALAVAAAVRGQPAACLSWGLVCLFSGGAIFLNSIHMKNLLPFSILGLIGFSALPFTPAWNGTEIYYTSAVVHLPTALLILLSLAALLAHALLLLGYLRHLLRLSELSSALERWAWAIYSLGLLLLLIVYFFLGFWTQPALKEVSWAGWSGGVAALGLAGILWFLNTRQPRVPRRLVMAILRIFSLNWLYSLIGLLYRSLRYLVDWITLILEGDGGILWAILLLALILSLIARQGLGG